MSEVDRFIPLDKSWVMRQGGLDLINGEDTVREFLAGQQNLSDDLLALKAASKSWPAAKVIPVGESGTLLRFLQFTSWKQGLDKKFSRKGTLQNRRIVENPDIIKLDQRALLKLDGGTSQWASAAVLNGDTERLPDAPHKLAVTYQAVEHWQQQREANEPWEPRIDGTIRNQALAFVALRKSGVIDFETKQAEDFPFAYVFGKINVESAAEQWPQLAGHESDRLVEVPTMLERAQSGEPINSRDHRIVQAIAMWAAASETAVEFIHPEAVNKSWPLFWNFLQTVKGDN